jgi:hypothetical protein
MLRRTWVLYTLLFFLSCVAFLLRLYRIDAPLADWHSWRQADTAAVARNFERFGIDLLRPRYDDLSNIQSGSDNPFGYRMVEMPLYQLAGAFVHRAVPAWSIEQSLRVVSAVASALSVFMLGVLLITFVGAREAVAGAFVYAILPFAVFYGRTILPDSFAVMWALFSLVLLTKKGWIPFLGAAVSAAISLLVRPMAGFLLLPALYLIAVHHRFSFGLLIRYGVYGALALAPFVWWRNWILQFPEGIPASGWLLNNNGIRFKGAWFHWLFARRVAELILGYWGVVLLGLGLVARRGKDRVFSLLWILGFIAYFVIFAGGNVQHDYYQVIMLPVIAWFVGKGIGFLWRGNPSIYPVQSYALAGICLLFGLAFSWYTVRTYYWINRPEIVEAGRTADELLPKDAKVIASYNGDTTFLYHTNRQGWPLGFDIAEKIEMGATHYVTVSPTEADGETNALASEYTVLVRNEKYAIIDLTKPAMGAEGAKGKN